MQANDQNQTDPMLAKEEIRQILGRAKRGDLSVLPQLRTFLDQHPEVWHRVGDLAEHAREALVTLASGTDLTGAESMRRKMQSMKEELIGESTAPVVRLLAEQCVLCWAQLQWAELSLVVKDQKGAPLGNEIQKRLNAIQGRYDRSIKTLVTVQRLLTASGNATRPNLKIAKESVA